jgi:ABC-type branched-subunit amino acid transport system permease subunit
MQRAWSLINGEVEPGRGAVFWTAFVCLAAFMALLPLFVGRFTILNMNSFLLMSFMAMGLALLWGVAGILSLGQSAFLGLGGYAYGVLAINFANVTGQTLLALIGGVAAAVLLAAIMSWIIFYGRLRGVYVAIITLVMALLFETFLNQTAGPQWIVGTAHLGGNNGLGRFSGDIQELPSLSVGAGSWAIELSGPSLQLYYGNLVLLVVCYLLLRMLVNSRFGLALNAIREDQDRTETLGYDVRLLQSIVFCIGAALAALSGVLYVSWGNFITPSVFGVASNILPVIWVAVAGRRSLFAAIVGAVVLQWASQALALQGEYALIVLGAMLVIAVLLLPEGLISLATRRPRPQVGGAGHAP